MKNLRTTIEKELDKLDTKWQALPLRKQCRYIIVLFGCYLVTGIGVLVKVCYDLGREERQLQIQHIKSVGVTGEGSSGQDSLLYNNKKIGDGRERE